ncbi:hypothetical protein DESC_610218 [Desulfosarcina cetonica]|nr:hypothetical protein DESC_610218 [Desulfosarcina cetonica]
MSIRRERSSAHYENRKSGSADPDIHGTAEHEPGHPVRADRAGQKLPFQRHRRRRLSFLGTPGEDCPGTGCAPGNFSGRSDQQGPVGGPARRTQRGTQHAAGQGQARVPEVLLPGQRQERSSHGALLCRTLAGIGKIQGPLQP